MGPKVRVALDWTPNCNHAGLAVAIERGHFAAAGLDVELVSPHVDGYKATPASRLADGCAEFALAPSESVVSWATWPAGEEEGDGGTASGGGRPRVVSVAAVLQGSASAIVTKASSGIDRPSKLDGRTYASFGARYEGRIVQAIVRRDGGRGEFAEATPPMLDIWDAFLRGDADATWIFAPWEGALAARAGVELHRFDPAAYVDYGYSPVVVARHDWLRSAPDTARAFLSAAARGYEEAAAQPKEAAAALAAYARRMVASGAWPELSPSAVDDALLAESSAAVAPYLLDKDGRWGAQDMDRWAKFVGFLDAEGMLTAKVQSRAPGPDRATLDELRSPGGGGPRVPAPAVADLATNEYLAPVGGA